MSIYQRLEPVFRDTFDAPDLVLTPELTARDVATWDSINHIRLMVAIEEEFRIWFATREIDGLNNVGELATLVEAKLADGTAAGRSGA